MTTSPMEMVGTGHAQAVPEGSMVSGTSYLVVFVPLCSILMLSYI
jgi:hypothetical protein